MPRPSRIPTARRSRPSVELLEGRQLLATFTVTSVADSGAGSLRQAILDSNATPGANVIDFNIAGSTTIAPATVLPTITVPVTIDGTSQPGYAGSPAVTIDGAQFGVGGVGLRITAGSSTVRGLQIVHVVAANLGNYRTFGDGGFAIELAGAGGNIIEGNYLGTDSSGSAILGNSAGIHILNSPGNTVGGTTAGARNVISGNTINYPDVPFAYGAGIVVDGAGSIGTLIAGNYIGTDPAGAKAVPNGTGIILSDAPGNTLGGLTAGARNVISGNNAYDVWLRLNSTGNTIVGNYFDADPTGETSIPGGIQSSQSLVTIAINLEDGSADNMIGGTTAAARNLIEPKAVGVSLVGVGVVRNQVLGNYIGVNAAGTRAISDPNFGSGVLLGAPANSIGGTAPGAGNLISGLAYGVYASPSFNPPYPGNTDLSGSIIQGNRIGTDASGLAAIPNYAGVEIRGDVTNLLIGGTTAGAGNVLANNTFGVQFGTGRLDTIRGNSIYNNTNSGIDLNKGIPQTANDNIPTPTLLTASAPAPDGSRVFTGSIVGGAPGATYSLDLFASPMASFSGQGQGKTYLGAGGPFTADGTGHVNFQFTATPPAGQTYVTVTATDQLGNTSEFSNALPRAPQASDLAVTIYPTVGYAGIATGYSIAVDNNGPDAAPNTVLTHTLPTGFTFVSASVSTGTFSVSGGVITANFGGLGVGLRAVLAVVATPSAAGTYTLSATATADDIDPNDGNNTGTATLTILPTPDLAITQTASPDPVTVGQPLTYTIVVKNNGPVAATNVVVVDTLPTGTVLASATTSQGTTQVSGDTLVAALVGRLEPGASATFVVVATATAAGALTNRVDVNADQPLPGNRESVLTTTAIAAPAPGPKVVFVRRVGFHGRPTQYLLTFDEPLLVARARSLVNYRLNLIGPGGKVGAAIALRSVAYNPATNTVTVKTKSTVALNRYVRLTVRGMPPTGLANANGVPLDGSRTGHSGTNYIATLLGFGVVDPGAIPVQGSSARPKGAKTSGSSGRSSR